MKPKRPMLAAPFSGEHVQYPLYLQPKFDGIRALLYHNPRSEWKLLSRTLKDIPNKNLQGLLQKLPAPHLIPGLDGELIVGEPTHPDCYRNTVKAVMSHHAHAVFKYYVFDIWDTPLRTFQERLFELDDFFTLSPHSWGITDTKSESSLIFEQVPSCYISNRDDLAKEEESLVSLGWEGLILRKPSGTYKHNRSTQKEFKLMKMCRWEEMEGVVIGAKELEHNNNPIQRGATGLAERSHHQDGKSSGHKLGSFLVRLSDGREVSVGSGYTDSQRINYWNNYEDYHGKTLTFKFKPHGEHKRPRHPIFKGWRNPGF